MPRPPEADPTQHEERSGAEDTAPTRTRRSAARRPDADNRPDVLHLARLARATPDAPLALPGADGALVTAHLTKPHADAPRARWYVCLAGELLVDLPHNEFAHLRTGETCHVPGGVERTLTPVRDSTVLIIERHP